MIERDGPCSSMTAWGLGRSVVSAWRSLYPACPERLDIDRIDVEGRPGLLEPFRSLVREADAQVPSGPLGMCVRQRNQRPGQNRSRPAQ